jgi:hypothetical protein
MRTDAAREDAAFAAYMGANFGVSDVSSVPHAGPSPSAPTPIAAPVQSPPLQPATPPLPNAHAGPRPAVESSEDAMLAAYVARHFRAGGV